MKHHQMAVLSWTELWDLVMELNRKTQIFKPGLPYIYNFLNLPPNPDFKVCILTSAGSDLHLCKVLCPGTFPPMSW